MLHHSLTTHKHCNLNCTTPSPCDLMKHSESRLTGHVFTFERINLWKCVGLCLYHIRHVYRPRWGDPTHGSCCPFSTTVGGACQREVRRGEVRRDGAVKENCIRVITLPFTKAMPGMSNLKNTARTKTAVMFLPAGLMDCLFAVCR